MPDQENLDDFIPPKDAADVLNQKEVTLTGWRCSGRGPAFYKVGRKVFYRRADILAWLQTRRCDPARKQSEAIGR